jgi:hypothetical protein
MSNETMREGVRRWALAGGVGLALLASGAGARAAAGEPLPPLPAMACPLIAAGQAPRIDGVLDEPIWAQGDVQQEFQRYYPSLDRPQDFRLLTDGEWLYVGVTAAEPAILDTDTETVSLFIAPQKASDQFVMFHVTVDSKGALKHTPEDHQSRWTSAFRQEAGRWVLESAIRVAPVFVQALAKGKVFDFNLSRTRSQVKGDSTDVYQQWSNTGTSSLSRYRFGEVTVGSPADRVPLIRSELQQEIEVARGQADSLSSKARQNLAELTGQAQALLAAGPGEGVLTSATVGQYQRQAAVLQRRIRQAVLADRQFVVWSCNPMATPMPADLPAVDQHDTTRLDIRVLAGEWESAALVVNNLTAATLDGRVSLTDFVVADGSAKAPAWDVLQVRSAPLITVAGSRKRDPLPRLQEGALFRVAADENELLWLTFKSRGLAPGRYSATLTIRSLDERLRHEVALRLRVYPLALGAVGRPAVHVWNCLYRGKDVAEQAANCRDYYLSAYHWQNMVHLPRFTANADGDTGDSKLDFRKVDESLDYFLQTGLHTYLVMMGSYSSPPRNYFWPATRSDIAAADGRPSVTFNFERWSPRFNELFARWVNEFRDHLESKGLPPERWAFYIMDEPPPGDSRQEVINFAREVRKIDPRVRTYITFPIAVGNDAENIEVSKHVDTVQVVGTARPEVMAQVRAKVRNFWTYLVLNRGASPFYAYRRDTCWESLKSGYTGTGFWCWDDPTSGNEFPWQMEGNAFFPAIYGDRDGTIIPSLRTEAFREGIEDWKYVLMLDDALAAARKKNVDVALVSSAQAFRARCLDEFSDEDSAYRFRDAARGHLLALHVAMGEVDAAVVQAVEAD